MGHDIVLASASPRRRVLLTEAGLDFDVDPADVDESVPPGIEPEELARTLAETKARAVAGRQDPAARRWVVGADTVVAVPTADGSSGIFGKPEDPADAERMLRALASSRHRVITGVAVVATPEGELFSDAETTWVTMRALTDAEVEAYVESGEWEDKAGGYAIQETADRFVTALEGGGFDNVVGLPVARTLELLSRAGAPLP